MRPLFMHLVFSEKVVCSKVAFSSFLLIRKPFFKGGVEGLFYKFNPVEKEWKDLTHLSTTISTGICVTATRRVMKNSNT